MVGSGFDGSPDFTRQFTQGLVLYFGNLNFWHEVHLSLSVINVNDYLYLVRLVVVSALKLSLPDLHKVYHYFD
jgi:hypothetical protein